MAPMPDFDSLNDDQIALFGCAVALLLCGGGMVLSYTLRRWLSGLARRAADQREIAADSNPHVAHPDGDRRRAA
jgi:hypothetical protein